MALLTSPSGCTSCHHLSEKIAELEQRVSILYKIQEAEKLIDTIVFRHPKQGTVFRIEDHGDLACGPADPVSPPLTCLADPTLPPLGAASLLAPAATPAAAEISVPEVVPADPWLLRGVKPKTLVSCATPLQPQHWEVADIHKNRGRHSPPSSCVPITQGIQLANCFDILNEDFPPLAAGQRSLPSPPPPKSKPHH